MLHLEAGSMTEFSLLFCFTTYDDANPTKDARLKELLTKETIFVLFTNHFPLSLTLSVHVFPKKMGLDS